MKDRKNSRKHLLVSGIVLPLSEDGAGVQRVSEACPSYQVARWAWILTSLPLAYQSLLSFSFRPYHSHQTGFLIKKNNNKKHVFKHNTVYKVTVKCVCIVCFPFCARSVCMKERKKERKKEPTPTSRECLPPSPTPGWLWHCGQVADPSNNQTILYLVAISPHLA